MAKIKDPILFSNHFRISPLLLDECGLLDPFLNVDTELFIDPMLLRNSNNSVISVAGYNAFVSHFSKFIRLLAISETEGDPAWKGAERLLDLKEPPENGLGYGGNGRSGSSRPEEVRDKILRTSKEIITLGSKDPEMISLMGFFEEGVGPDTISDFTTRVIMSQLAGITQEFCKENCIPTLPCNGFSLPQYKNKFLVLVPKDIVRDLPIANDWSDVNRAVMASAHIRNSVNAFLGGIAEPTIVERKQALRLAALASAKSFEEFLDAVKNGDDHYDPSLDALGYYALRRMLSDLPEKFRLLDQYRIAEGPDKLRHFVLETLNQFKHHVENCNLWEELWIEGKPKKERAAQLIYYAMADCFCRVNNVDVSPEANMGGGPIDFKFSKGYDARVLVEIKRSSGKVVHGYQTQLEIYKNAARTEFGIYVVIDYGGNNSGIEKIREIRSNVLASGGRASDILVIDATTKESASVRKGVKETIAFNFGE